MTFTIRCFQAQGFRFRVSGRLTLQALGLSGFLDVSALGFRGIRVQVKDPRLTQFERQFHYDTTNNQMEKDLCRHGKEGGLLGGP